MALKQGYPQEKKRRSSGVMPPENFVRPRPLPCLRMHLPILIEVDMPYF